MKFLVEFIFVILFFFIFSENVFACTCREGGVPTCAEYGRVDAVFMGKIERITAFDAGNQDVTLPPVNSISTFKGSGLVWLHVKVEKAFKGVADKIVKVTTYRGTSCDLGVKKGEKWMFYAYRDAESGILGVGSCGGSHRISGKPSENSDYLAELEKLSRGEFGTFVRGTFVRDAFTDERQNAAVSIEGEGFAASLNTGATGDFSFRVPRAGKYKIRAVVPFSAFFYFTNAPEISSKNSPTETETVFEYEAQAEENKCFYEQVELHPVDLKATAEMRGKFVQNDWKFFPRFFPRLCRLKETEEATLQSCLPVYSLKMDGSFEVKGLREGNYTLVINEDEFPDGTSPFWRHYYPGVRNFADAVPIILQQGQKLEDLRFNLPPMLPVREIKGRVFWKDGKPATFIPDSENELDITLYQYEKPHRMLFMNSFQTVWNEKGESEEREMITIAPDGTFSITAFEGFTYLLRADFELPNDKIKCGFAKLKIDENIQQPLKIILERTDKCSAEDYFKELEAKPKNGK